MNLRFRGATDCRTCLVLLAAAALAMPARADERPTRWPLLGGALVLSSRPADAWAKGPARVEQLPTDNDVNLVTVREVDESRLPASLRRLRGVTVRTLADDGASCLATVDGFTLIGFDDSPQDDLSRVPSTDEPERPDAFESRPRLAALAWRHSHRFLKATLKSDCNLGGWALLASVPAPIPFERDEPSPTLRAAVMKAWVALPEYAALDRAWRRSPRELPDGSRAKPSYVEHRPPRLARFVLGERVLVVARALDELPCWPFHGALWAVWRVTGDASAPRLERLHAGCKPHRGLEPKSVFLVDGRPILFVGWQDGRSAYVGRDGALVRDGALEVSTGDDTFICNQ